MEFIIDVEVYDMNITMDRGKVVEIILLWGSYMWCYNVNSNRLS